MSAKSDIRSKNNESPNWGQHVNYSLYDENETDYNYNETGSKENTVLVMNILFDSEKYNKAVTPVDYINQTLIVSLDIQMRTILEVFMIILLVPYVDIPIY